MGMKLRKNKWADGQTRMLARGPVQTPQPSWHKKKEAMSGKQRVFQAIGNCNQISPHTMMKNQSFDKELEVPCCKHLSADQLWSILRVPRVPTTLTVVVSHVLWLRSELHIFVFILNVVLKQSFVTEKVMRLGHYFHTNVLPEGLGQLFSEHAV